MHITLLITVAAILAQTPAPKPSAPVTPDDALMTQVMLDRAGFSPGAIDGRMGANTKKALDAYKSAVKEQSGPVEGTTTYTITEADAAGPFVKITGDLMEQSKLPALSYQSVIEMIAERFHTTPAFLQRLNAGAGFAAGEQIKVPNVEPMVIPADAPKVDGKMPKAQADAEAAAARERAAAKPDVTVTVTKSTSALTVADASGRVLMYAPVTTGSEKDPLPIGEWKVNGVQLNPPFHYNPDLFWDADPSHAKAKIPPGPNNPVGLVWVDITKEHYGIHGTPEPATIGRAESHGCVRLTNWDALRLSGLVKPGTRVIFKQ